MNNKIYVGNLAPATTENDLMNLFSSYGNVAEVHVPMDRVSGKSHRFGFVTMATPQGAQSAIEALNGKALGLCSLDVSEAPLPGEHARALSGRRSPRRVSSFLF
jgi:RNA recognition motif-containing protein